jgi:hypothetical protein
MPSTLRRSSREAQETWIKAHDGAVRMYGEGQRASRSAYAALKHDFQKVGHRWKPKEGHAPSEKARRETGQQSARAEVDPQASKERLYRRARELHVRGRSSMTKKELINALQRASEQRTRRIRER